MKINNLALFPTPVSLINNFVSASEVGGVFDWVINNKDVFTKHNALMGDSISSHGSYKAVLDEPWLSFLKERIQDQLNIYCCNSGFSNTQITNSWINIQNVGSILETHTHATSHISGALYLNTDENSSRIFFFNPNQCILYTPIDEKSTTQFNNSFFYLQPKIGDLILFPSWLQHGSFRDVNQTKDRTVLSFNSSVK